MTRADMFKITDYVINEDQAKAAMEDLDLSAYNSKAIGRFLNAVAGLVLAEIANGTFDSLLED